MTHQCKKCLLLEAGEKKSYKSVVDYLSNLESELKVSDKEYNARLQKCRKCDQLISGMCRKCGCYVEIRAALKNKCCADYDSRQW